MGRQGRTLLLATSLVIAAGAAVWRLVETPAPATVRFRVVQRLEHPMGGVAPSALALANDAHDRWTADEVRATWTRVQSGKSATLRSPRLDLGDDFHAIVVRLRPAGTRSGAPAMLLWSDLPTLDAAAFARNRRLLPAASSSPTAVMLEHEALESDRRQPIRYLFLHLPDGGDAGEIVEAVALVTTRDLAAGATVARLAAGGQTRDAIAAGTPLAFRVKVPASAELGFGLRVAGTSAKAALRVTQSAGGREVAVIDAPITTGGWIDFRSPLNTPGDSTLTFAVSGAGASDAPVYWSVPQILAPDTDERPNVVLYVVDALRADKLGLYGSQAGVSPFLDQLARRSRVFRHAYAPASWTKPSVATLLTSLYPATHALGARHYTDALPRDVPTLQGEMAAAGYATAQFSSNPFTGAASGLDRGFDVATTAGAYGPASAFEVMTGAVQATFFAWLSKRPRDRFFAYLHTVETHPPFGGRAAASPSAAYEAAIASVDRALARLCQQLEEMQLIERTILIVTADHGEAFGEHGRTGHGQSVYEEEIRVPLIVHGPGRVASGWVEDPVHLVDVMPTVLEYAGVSFDAEKLQGRSLMPQEGRATPPSPVVVTKFTYPEDVDAPGNRREMHALVDFPWKLIAVDRTDAIRDHELYRLDTDPAERHDLARAEPRRTRQLELALDAFLRDQACARARFARAHGGATPPRVAPGRELIDQLRSLGYVR